MSSLQNDGTQLSRRECLRLLGSVPIGRVAFSADALPSVQPVNFVLHDGQVVFRTAVGSTLDAAVRNAIVAFEVDDYDSANRTGWTVTAVGPATVVIDPDRVAELARLPLRSATAGDGEHYVTIAIEIVHGRRIAVTSANTLPSG